MENISFNEYKQSYNNQNNLCGEDLGHLYNSDKNKLSDVPCMKWNCEICRPILQKILYDNIVMNVLIFDLNKHFVITSPGKEFRSKYTWYESYKHMSVQWNNFLKVIKYHYGDIDYILLPRAQGDGYCHYHILTNTWLDWKFLNKKRKKYDIGYLTITKSKSVADYLYYDYYNDHEWFIPDNVKHYRSSRSIILNNVEPDHGIQYFNNQTNLKQISNFVEKLYGKNLDLNEYNEFRNAKKEFREYFKALKNKYPELNRSEIKNIVNKILPNEIYNILNKNKEVINE